MGTSKRRFYWLKLKSDFFNAKEIKKLRRIAGGDTFTIIYLKMLLKSLKNEGRLFFEGIEDTFVEELALDIDEDVDNVKVTVLFLEKQGLLFSGDTVEYTLPQAVENVGSEGISAERMRRLRKSKEQALQCNANVTKCNVEIEKEIDIDINNNILSCKQDELPSQNSEVSQCAHNVKESDVEIEKEIDIDINNILSCKQDDMEDKSSRFFKKSNKDNEFITFRNACINYLNEKIGTNFKLNSKSTSKLLKARYNEGFTVDDVKTAIDKKVAEWQGTDMAKYLRPVTLFGNKMEAYVNQLEVNTNDGKCKADNRKAWQRNDWSNEPEAL